MSDFDPGEGWREVPNKAEDGQEYLIHGTWPSPTRLWVREEPVPPLPTEPYTVIRVTWADGGVQVLMCGEDGRWWHGLTSDEMRVRITDWEPLAEPREVTVKAVLARVAYYVERAAIDPVECVSREFELEGS